MMHWFHIGIVAVGFIALTAFSAYDLFWLKHAFSASGYGMALGALAGGSGIGMGGFMYGAQTFLGSSGGNITEN